MNMTSKSFSTNFHFILSICQLSIYFGRDGKLCLQSSHFLTRSLSVHFNIQATAGFCLYMTQLRINTVDSFHNMIPQKPELISRDFANHGFEFVISRVFQTPLEGGYIVLQCIETQYPMHLMELLSQYLDSQAMICTKTKCQNCEQKQR